MLDLATRDNWQLILTEERVVTSVKNTQPGDDPYYYTPIPPIYATPQSHILLVGIKSNAVKPHWFLGAIASQFLYVSPNIINQYVGGVQAEESKKIGLNRVTLIEFKNYGIKPYVLQLTIPYWIKHIKVEVWEYTGLPIIGDDDVLDRLNEILTRIVELENAFDSIENYGI